MLPATFKSCSLFNELYDHEIKLIVKNGRVSTYRESDVMIADGSEGEEIHILLDGRAEVRKETDEGMVMIQELIPGDVFGEMVLLDERKRWVDVVAVHTCHVLELKYSDIYKLYEKKPKIFGIIALNMARLVTRRLRASNDIVTALRSGIKKAM